MTDIDDLPRRTVLRYGTLAAGLTAGATATAAGRPSAARGGTGFMTARGLGKIEPGDRFRFRHRIDGMQWRIDPGCDGGTDYEYFQNWSIGDESSQTAGLLLPPDREMPTPDEGGWHELRVIRDDCGVSPDDGANRHLQRVQFAPATGAPGRGR